MQMSSMKLCRSPCYCLLYIFSLLFYLKIFNMAALNRRLLLLRQQRRNRATKEVKGRRNRKFWVCSIYKKRNAFLPIVILQLILQITWFSDSFSVEKLTVVTLLVVFLTSWCFHCLLYSPTFHPLSFYFELYWTSYWYFLMTFLQLLPKQNYIWFYYYQYLMNKRHHEFKKLCNKNSNATQKPSIVDKVPYLYLLLTNLSPYLTR